MYAKILWCIVDTASCRGVIAFCKHNHTHTQYMHAPDGPSDLTAAAILEVWIRCKQLACCCVCYHADDRKRVFMRLCRAAGEGDHTRRESRTEKGGGVGVVQTTLRGRSEERQERREKREESVSPRDRATRNPPKKPQREVERGKTRRETKGPRERGIEKRAACANKIRKKSHRVGEI